jgi:hypothetical protein
MDGHGAQFFRLGNHVGPGRALETVNLDEGDIKLIVWRQGFELHIEPLDAAESQLLHAIKKRLPLEALIKRMNNAPLPFEKLLPSCVAKGWISEFTLAPTGQS